MGVTAAADFIGSNIVAGFSTGGIDDIRVVDDSVDDCEARDYGYSRTLQQCCAQVRLPFLYTASAAVYGRGLHFVERRAAGRNMCAFSKFACDPYVPRPHVGQGGGALSRLAGRPGLNRGGRCWNDNNRVPARRYHHEFDAHRLCHVEVVSRPRRRFVDAARCGPGWRILSVSLAAPAPGRLCLRECRRGRRFYWWDAQTLAGEPEDGLFEAAHWRAAGRLLHEARGRGAAHFVRAKGERSGPGAWVLCHYRRGGLFARVNHDRYLWTGAARSRPGREMRLLATLYNRGLAVPRPVAARAERCAGFWYRADLLKVAIRHGLPLADRLMRGPMAGTGWQALGGLIAGLHRADVWHADLNARNILVCDDTRFYLLDFDRARYRADGTWRRANLARLRSSLDKFAIKALDFQFAEQDWAALVGGYQSGFAAGA